jgi:hypothetical protein
MFVGNSVVTHNKGEELSVVFDKSTRKMLSWKHKAPPSWTMNVTIGGK